MKRLGKKGIEIEMLVWILLAVIVLVLAVVGFTILSGKGSGALSYIRNLFRFGGG